MASIYVSKMTRFDLLLKVSGWETGSQNLCLSAAFWCITLQINQYERRRELISNNLIRFENIWPSFRHVHNNIALLSMEIGFYFAALQHCGRFDMLSELWNMDLLGKWDSVNLTMIRILEWIRLYLEWDAEWLKRTYSEKYRNSQVFIVIMVKVLTINQGLCSSTVYLYMIFSLIRLLSQALGLLVHLIKTRKDFLICLYWHHFFACRELREEESLLST